MLLCTDAREALKQTVSNKEAALAVKYRVLHGQVL